MARPSSIDRLGPEMLREIVDMRAAGSTIEEILARLREKGMRVSRSALRRHVKRLGEPCPVGVAQELAALRASVDQLAEGLAGLRSELGEIRKAELLALHGKMRELVDGQAEIARVIAAQRLSEIFPDTIPTHVVSSGQIPPFISQITRKTLSTSLKRYTARTKVPKINFLRLTPR